ncbi:SusC/RagA family TonB-linked outer membrane protein [Bacteroides caccae]|uniref:SusC/RagA family TonB-linked outer membrane protein n=1 Tax=Bacteroides caccae TaxID=47678 RepID=UPI0034A5601B
MNSFTRIGLRSRFLLVLMIGLILPTLSVWGQNATITGKVVDPKGEPLVGVSVLEQGTTNGTVTDMNGRYSIVVQKDSSPLRFSYMGFDNQEIVPGKRRVIDVTLTENSVVIDDVVVIAYGTKKRRDMIGSVSKIKSDEMSLMQGGRFENSLQGLASGVQVVNDGMPGSTPQIKIRGIGSIASGSDPLWVVDGIVGGGSTMVNSNDIESIEVLKDAAATAIYGSRGANGVIIVTTKKGKKGGLKFDVHYEGGITPITNSDLGLASTKTYFNIMDEARANVGLNPLDPQKDIIEPYYSNWTSPITREEAMNTDMDWVDLVTRMGHFHDINVALNQGGENSTTYASVNYRSDESSLKGLSMNAVSARLNSEFKKGIVTLGTQSFLKFDRKKSTNKWAVVSDKFPWRKVYDPEDPTGYWNPQMADGHPTATLDNDYQLSTGENFSFRTTLYMDVNLKWIKGLSVRADASYGYGLAQSDYWLSGLITNTGNVDGNQGNKSKKTTRSQQYHAFAKYNREWTDHGLDIVTGIEANRSYTDNAVVAGKNLSGEFQEPKIIGTMLGNNSAYIGGESYTFSFFNRIDYKFKQRYLLGASFVREGSSKFVKENRFGDFYSVSGGWIISDEAFMRNAGFISLLKLRGSYGETGNQNIPSEVTKNSYSIKSKQYYNNMQNMFLWNIANKAAKWEKNKSIDLGLDYALFNNKVNGSIAYYRRTTSDMLMRVQLPASAGITNSGGNADNNSMWANVGSMYNQGFEFDINVTLVKKDFEWNMNYNLTTNMNKVTALDASVDAKGTGIINTRPGAITKKDLALGTYFMAEWAGVDPEKGIGMIYEIDLDRYNKTGETVKTGRLIPATQSNVNKHRIIQEGKTALPKVYMGWTNNFKYKAFDLSFLKSATTRII